jgi:phage terminase small subunit
MGGKGSGGSRVGAGRRRQNSAIAAVLGTRRDDIPTLAPVEMPSDGPMEAPIALSVAAAAIWTELEPLAKGQGTLLPSTKLAFGDLCEAVALKRALLARVEADGYVVSSVQGIKAHPLLARYQTTLQQTKDMLTRFKLAPIGKEIAAPEEKTQSPLEKLQAQSAQLRAVK